RGDDADCCRHDRASSLVASGSGHAACPSPPTRYIRERLVGQAGGTTEVESVERREPTALLHQAARASSRAAECRRRAENGSKPKEPAPFRLLKFGLSGGARTPTPQRHATNNSAAATTIVAMAVRYAT